MLADELYGAADRLQEANLQRQMQYLECGGPAVGRTIADAADRQFPFKWVFWRKYFLLRLKNPKSRLHGRSKKMVSKILSFMADMLRKPEKQKVLSLSSVAVLEETVDWVKEVCDVHICEKQVVILLERLYYLQEKGMLGEEADGKNALRRQIWDFYY